jgi:putative addiction module antidote
VKADDKGENMVTQTVRKAGNSLAITIPKEEVERLGLREGDIVALQLNRVRVEVELPADILSHARQSLREHAEAYRILADR